MKRKILVIQQKMIGDVLTSTILCEQLKKNIPDSEIHYLIYSHTEAVVANNPHIDRVILFTQEYRESKPAFYKFLKEIKRAKYDTVIDAYGKLEGNLVSLFSKANIKISRRKWYSSFIYTHAITNAIITRTKLGLAVENRLSLLSPILPEVTNLLKPPKIYLTHTEIDAAKDFLEKKGIDTSKHILMIGVLGSGKNKTYPLPYMAKVINTIAEKFEGTLLFNYIPSQKKEVEKLYGLCGEKAKKQISIEIYAPSLRSFLGVLHHCQAIIGNEGGAINMAKALGVPSFSIFSPWITKIAWDTYNSDNMNIAVHLGDFHPELFENKSKKELKKEAFGLYQKFEPSFFNDDLKKFLKGKIFSN